MESKIAIIQRLAVYSVVRLAAI